MIRANPTLVPAHLQGTYQMLQGAFPDGVPESAYHPMLALLCEHMSFRAVANVVAALTGKDYGMVYHDVLGVASPANPSRPGEAAREMVKQLLAPHGFVQWLAKE